MKIIKNNQEYDVQIVNENFVSEVKILAKDKIFFNCIECGKEASRRKQLWKKPYSKEQCLCRFCNGKKTNLKKYGADNPSKNEQVKNKIKQTKLERYGNENFVNKDKIQKNRNKEEAAIKTKQTKLEKYGSENYNNLEKQKQTMLETYGVENIFQNKNFQEKKKQVNLEKYGSEHYTQTKEYKEKTEQIKRENYYNKLLERQDIIPLFDKEEYVGARENNLYKNYKWKCTACGNEFFDNFHGEIICKKCNPKPKSLLQKEISDFITSLGIAAKENLKILDGYEIDIFIPEKNIGFEIHGLYYHTQSKLEERNENGKKYHLKKLQKAQEKNIRLIQIFEDEWRNKKEVVKSRIKHFLGIFERKVMARKLMIKEIDSKTKVEFFKKYHIQGDCPASIKLGAFLGEELISVMSFGVKRVAMGQKKQKEREYELLRFATKKGVLGQGIASKLFSYFVKNYSPKEIITYSDKRWNTGNLYKQLGFNYSHASSPNYFYVINGERKHRFNYRKQLLEKKLDYFDSNKTEYENMLDNNIDRIFDCGNDVWKLSLN